jgi:hypothetical protein
MFSEIAHPNAVFSNVMVFRIAKLKGALFYITNPFFLEYPLKRKNV